jgi:predicted ATPase
MSHFNTLANALYHAGLLCLLLRDFTALGAMANRLYEVAEEHAAAAWAANGRMMLGCIRLASEAGEESLAQLHLDIEAVRAFGWRVFLPCFETIEASGYGRLGDSQRGLSLLAETLVGMEQTDQRLVEAEYHRVRAGLLCIIGATWGDAEAAFARAIHIAQQQNARTFELRAATELARLWLDQGRRAEARDLLAPVYGWFTEGFETADLKDAKALLDELA